MAAQFCKEIMPCADTPEAAVEVFEALFFRVDHLIAPVFKRFATDTVAICIMAIIISRFTLVRGCKAEQACKMAVWCRTQMS